MLYNIYLKHVIKYSQSLKNLILCIMLRHPTTELPRKLFFISSILHDHMKMTLLRGGVDFFCRE